MINIITILTGQRIQQNLSDKQNNYRLSGKKLKEVLPLTKAIGKGWTNVASYLDLKQSKIDQIQLDNNVSGVKAFIREMMSFWLQSQGSNATLGRLMTALVDAEDETEATIDWDIVKNMIDKLPVK